jgi:acyl dehydratase
MPIDLERLLSAEIPEQVVSWDADDVILYHLGLGAGARPSDPGELGYVLEDRLRVLPSFGVIPVLPMVRAAMLTMPGLDIDPAMILHGEQDLEVLAPLTANERTTTRACIAGVFDTGKGAVVEFESLTVGATPLFRNRFSIFVRGEGGFGGPRRPAPGNEPPARDPDIEIERATLPQQALLYRLTGDRNPLHADPDFARLGGFDQPILHGLCTYGIVCKAVVDEALGGDTARVSRYQARFAGVVLPGETIVVRMWLVDDDRTVVTAHTKDRGNPVLTNAAVFH